MEGARELLDGARARTRGGIDSAPQAAKLRAEGPRRAEGRPRLDAYWRQQHLEEGAVIFAGPGTNLLFAIVLFFLLFLLGRRQRLGFSLRRSIHRPRGANRPPGRRDGSAGGRQIIAVNGDGGEAGRGSPARSSTLPRGVHSTITVRRDGQRRRARSPGHRRRYRLGFRLKADRLGRPRALSQSVRLTGRDHEGDRCVARPARAREREGGVEPRGHRRRLVAGARAGRTRRTCGCSGSSASRLRCSTCCRCSRSTAVTSRSRSSRESVAVRSAARSTSGFPRWASRSCSCSSSSGSRTTSAIGGN